MRITRKQFFFLAPVCLLIAAMVIPSTLSPEQTLIWVKGNEHGGSYSWDNMPADSSDDSHTLQLKLPVTRPVFFHVTSGSGTHGINLLPGSPSSSWRDSSLRRNKSGHDWIYPADGWVPAKEGTYVFYCPLHPEMWMRVVASAGSRIR